MFARTFVFAGVVALLATGSFHDVRERVAPGAIVSLAGRIVETGSGRPLTGAQVTIQGTSVGALSASGGRYTFTLDDSWSGRSVTVEVQMIGYAIARHTTVLSVGSNTLDFALQPQVMALEELVVTGTPGEARRRSLGNVVSTDAASRARRKPRGDVAPIPAGGVLAPPNRFAPPVDREGYAHVAESGFRSVRDHPLSTFSIDVDRASYSNVRRFVTQGVRPPIDAVRIEELVNYFPYADPAPTGDVPFSVTTEVAPAPWQPLHHLVRVGLRGRSIDMREAPANNLVFLLDVSGSMGSPDKLPLLKTALSMLVEQLRPQDRVAIVVYAGAAGLVLPSTPGNQRGVILDALERLQAGGSTAGGAGIRLAYDVARENHVEEGNNRVILATDGDFNVGASSDAEMVRLIEEKREQGTFLTVLGFGTGNLQDAKMEQIADHGNGNFAYIDGPLEAKKVLVAEMGGTLLTIAKDVKIQVEFNPARVAAYRLIGYENRLLADEDFNDDRKDAGELGAGHSVTALYEIVPTGVESPVTESGVDALRYQTPRSEVEPSDRGELMFVKLRYKEPKGDESRLLTHPVERLTDGTSDDFRFAAAVAAWGMLLRDSEYCTGFTLGEVSRMARHALGDDPGGYRAEFVQLVDRARSLELLGKEPVLR